MYKQNLPFNTFRNFAQNLCNFNYEHIVNIYAIIL